MVTGSDWPAQQFFMRYKFAKAILSLLVQEAKMRGHGDISSSDCSVAVMAARRIAKELNLDIKYLVADGRFLPFRDHQFKVVYSYTSCSISARMTRERQFPRPAACSNRAV